MKKYVWAMDVSLSQTGYSIFDEDKTLVCYGSIPTKSKDSTGKRLKVIGDKLLVLNKIYPPNEIIREKGFSRFPLATEQIFRVNGMIEYLFSDIEFIEYSPRTVKKILTGNGKSDKKEVANMVKLEYPNDYENEDITDSIATAITHFRVKGI